ncbi:hypothetical protein ACFVVX_03735 [Kitasatospora sp. NPDC058170]|uniref:hypothetical protein n=1 Tax=Kitasatospora sp. NPDC058170 TaxID=3346364 RepID=UPI0036DB6E4B
MTDIGRIAARAATGWGVAGWGAAYAVLGAGCAGGGRALFGLAWLGWAVAAVGGAAVAVGLAVARRGLQPPLRRALLALCALAVVAAFSLLMDVITLIFGQGVDSRADAGLRALSAVGAVLLAATARPDRPVPAADPVGPAPRRVQLAACAGTLAFAPYVVMKLVWVLGGTFAGTDGAEMRAASERNGASGVWLALESWGVDGTVLLAALGVFLLWGLVRPWGRVFPRWTLVLRGRPVPRWLPLTPALLGAATLVPYGTFGVGYLVLATGGAVTIRPGDFHSEADVLLVAWIGFCAFAVYGVALAVAARSYWRRTGPGRRPS